MILHVRKTQNTTVEYRCTIMTQQFAMKPNKARNLITKFNSNISQMAIQVYVPTAFILKE
jgi:hypothetical protein